MINLGGDIGIGATAFRRRESSGANTAFLIALALVFIACLGVAAFFLDDHDQILAIAALGLAAFLGLRLFFRWWCRRELRRWFQKYSPLTIAPEQYKCTSESNQETLQHVGPVLKIVHSEDALSHPARYTTCNDPGTCSENTRLACYTMREGKALTALAVASGIELRTGTWNDCN